MTGVRFRVGEGWEGRCDICRTWLPLEDTADHWKPSSGYTRCQACWNLYEAHKYRTGERLTPDELAVLARRERHRIYNRLQRSKERTEERRRQDVERSRRYRARRRAIHSVSTGSGSPVAGHRGYVPSGTQQALDNGGASQPTIEDPNVSLPERAA